MDRDRFDAAARLLGASADRREGLLAALGMLIGIGGMGSAVAAEDRERVVAEGRPSAEGPCVDYRVKNNRCMSNSECCTNYCERNMRNKDRIGRCRCRRERTSCAATSDCCSRRGQQLQCLGGICTRPAVATGSACRRLRDVCADPQATCTTHAAGGQAGTFCLLGAGQPCATGAVCISSTCPSGVCVGGPAVIPSGEACTANAPATAEVCADANAVCARYDAGSGGPAGTHCVAPEKRPCRRNDDCQSWNCHEGICGGGPVDTGETCTPGRDICKDPEAACTDYTTDPDRPRCLLGDSAACSSDRECIANKCRNKRCNGGPNVIPTGQRCDTDPEIDICADGAAACGPYAGGSGGPGGNYCALPDGDSCDANRDCQRFSCSEGICQPQPVPTGQACDPAQDRCADPNAACGPYAAGSGGPDGTFCALPDLSGCGAAAQCQDFSCHQGVCRRPPAGNGQPCAEQFPDACLDANAVCMPYEGPGMPQGAHCLLPDGAACAGLDVCQTAYCDPDSDACGPCALIPSGSSDTCSADGDCCSGYCAIIAGRGRCLGPNQVHFHLSWTTQDLDLDSWLWLPAGTPNQSGTAASFPDGGDIVFWRRLWYPYTVDPEPDNEKLPGGAVDVWLDIDDRSGPGDERMLILHPVPGGVYRYSVRNYDACPKDKGATDACGADWSNLDEDWEPLSQTDARVDVYLGRDLYRTFTAPNRAPDPATHYYWWGVTDVAFDSDGNFLELRPYAGKAEGQLRDCCPTPYPMNVYTPNSQDNSNYCPVD